MFVLVADITYVFTQQTRALQKEDLNQKKEAAASRKSHTPLPQPAHA